jgi:hypothetical protein
VCSTSTTFEWTDYGVAVFAVPMMNWVFLLLPAFVAVIALGVLSLAALEARSAISQAIPG